RGDRREVTAGPPSIHVRVGAEVLEDLLPLLLVDHQVHAVAAVAALDLALGLAEQRQVTAPVAGAAALTALLQALLPRRPQALQQLVLQAEEELRAAGVALPAGTAHQLAVDAQRLVPLRA